MAGGLGFGLATDGLARLAGADFRLAEPPDLRLAFLGRFPDRAADAFRLPRGRAAAEAARRRVVARRRPRAGFFGLAIGFFLSGTLTVCR